MTSKISYQGELRTSAIHLKSNTELITDAPIDNHGKGATFSPTDLVATALGSCMLTIMGIVANKKEIDFKGASIDIEKVMESNPRRIAEIKAKVTLAPGELSVSDKRLLETAARNCPVAKSLSQDLVQNISFEYQEAS